MVLINFFNNACNSAGACHETLTERRYCYFLKNVHMRVAAPGSAALVQKYGAIQVYPSPPAVYLTNPPRGAKPQTLEKLRFMKLPYSAAHPLLVSQSNETTAGGVSTHYRCQDPSQLGNLPFTTCNIICALRIGAIGSVSSHTRRARCH